MSEILVCVREEHGHTHGSVLTDASCGHRVWVSTSGQIAMRDRGIQPVCVQCAIILMAQEDNASVQTLPGALDEIQRSHGPGARDQLEATLRDHGIMEYYEITENT